MGKIKKQPTIEGRVKAGYIDLTKTGPLSYRELRSLNNGLPEESVVNAQRPDNIGVITALQRAGKVNYTEQPTGLGESMYDPGVANQEQIENLQDYRAEAQPWYAKIGAGLAKGMILAGTTFLDGTIGLLVGGVESIKRGDISGLWDNDFSKAMQAINEWSEETFPNYYSQNELNSPWYENIFTANFLGDKLIKNLGFSIGAIYSGGVYAAPLKAAKVANAVNTVFRTAKATPMVSSAVGSTLAAVNEGRVEALNNSKDWFELQKQQLDDWYDQKLISEYKPLFDKAMAEYNATKGTLVQGPDNSMYDPAYLRYKSKVEALQNEFNTKRQNRESDKVYSSTLSKITEDRLKMGNADLLMNIPILTASNLIQFGKFFGGGYRTARKTTNIAGRAGNYTAGTTKLGTSVSLAKGALSEGLEEISQKAASVSAGNYYATDVSNWYKSQIDPNAEKETLDWMKSIAQGVNETVNDGSSWEEFFIGTLTGALGVPTFRSPKSSDGSFRSPIVMQGGAYNGWKEYQQKVAREQEIADYMNSRVQSPKFLNYYQGLIRHNKYQADMNKAVEEGNEFDFKNAEHAQLISDIVMFDNAGKLGDLEALIGTSLDTSEENLESIVRNTTAVGENNTPIGPFAQYARVDSDGQISVDFGDSGVQEMTSKLNNTREEFSNTIKNYVKIKDDLDVRTGEVLSDEQLQELTWMKSQLGNWTDRATAMSGEVKQVIGKVIGNLDSFIRFQDVIRTEEGMNNANLTDRYNRADKNVRDAQRAVASLNVIRNLDDANLAATLAKNPDFVKGLMKEVSLLDDTVIEADEREDVLNKLADIIKLGNAADVYNAKFKEYLSNPGQQVADHERANQETAQVVQKENNASLRQKLDQATSVAQFREILSSEQDAATRDAVLQTMESEDNQIAKNYRETLQYNNELSAALNELGETDQVAQDAMTLWKEQFNTAENLEQLANPNTIFINNEEAFMEDSGGDIDIAGNRFQSARYALQRAMSKVNNDIKFKNRFSKEYKRPVNEPIADKGIDKDETGDSETPTPVGNVTAEMVASENSDANKSVKTQRDLDRGQQGQRKYYRPAIPELHIEASKEGDFRPFDTVVAEREQGVDFSGIYSYLRDNGAFNYVNAAKLKPGDILGFMIDPEFNDHTIFLVDTRNNQIVGSIDESDASVARYEGLENLIKRVRDEYQASRRSDTVDGSPVALSYLLENGVGTIESAGYFLHAVAAAFPVISEDIESMRNSLSLDGEVLGMKPDAFVSSNNPVIKRIEAFIKEYYGEEGVNIYNELLKNSTGFVPAEGKQMDARIEKLVPLKDAPRTATTRFFATPQVRVSKMMVGRIPYTSEERSLADIPGVLDGETKPIFGIIKNGVLTTNLDNINEEIDDRLIIKPADMAHKEGRLYLLIPNAAGTYSPAAVRVKHFNTQEFNLADATVANTPVGKDINEALDRLADAASQDDVSIAMKELAQDIYMQDVMITWFDAKAGSGIVVSKKVRKPDGTYEMVTINGQEQIKEEKTTIYFQSSKKSAIINGMEIDIEAAKEMGADLSPFGQPRDTADIRKDILNTILRYNLPLQVDASMINKSSYNNRLIKSNILTSNLREAKVIGSWFITDYFNNQGNLQRAVSPASVKPAPSRKVSSPVGGTEGVVQGTRVIISGTPYIVDLKSNMAINEKTGEKRAFSAFNSQSLIDMAWAQETFGDATESSRMTENKIITPNGDVLDRSTGHYITGDEAQRIKDKIAGKNKETESRIAQSKRVIADIYENQNKVDKARTDKDYYYILEEDGQYHQYSRVHSRLGDNWLGERTETENSKRALEVGTDVDKVIRDFFTLKETPTRPETLSEGAFIDLITKLTEIKSKMEQMGETFMTNNVVLFQKYADGTRVAGEVDILSVDKNGNFKIYDVKTSRYSFSDRYFNEKSSMQRMSTKDYYTLQLSAYQNLFESQYGVRPTRLAILPFVLSYNTVQATAVDIPSGTQTRLGLPVAGNQSYFRTDRKVDDNEARFVSSEKDGKVYFKPILDTKAHEATLKSTDAAKSVVEFTGGDPKEATHFVLVEPGEATRNPENGRLMVSKKAKVFAVTPSTPYSNGRSIVTSITQEKGIPITYNPAVNVPLASAVHAPATSSNLPIFDSTMETMITNPKEQNRVLPENAFEEGGEIGYYEKDGKLYTGYLKKIGEVEVTYGSGRKDMVPIHVTKVRDTGFGREGEFGSTSEYLTVFPNGKAISTRTNDTNDAHAAEIIMKALSAKPEKVLLLSSEKTQIHNPRELEESDAAIRIAQETTPQSQGGASRTVQKENAVNQKAAKRTRHKLRAADSTRPIWDREKEMSWLEKALPQLSEQDRVKVVEGLIQVAENGPIAWGMFSDGVVTLSDIAAEGTTYHEAFHVVFNLMLTPQERSALFTEARQQYGNKSEVELEEDMAEGFREYVTTRQNAGLLDKIKNFFKDLWIKVTNWSSVRPHLTAYYQMINKGKYSNRELPTETLSQAKARQEEYSKEMQDILDKAPRDSEGNLLAPNGKKSNLESATSNNGEFSTTNDDIRYREVDINDSEFKDLKQDLTSFFSNFGITIEDTSKFDSEEPIFNALDRVINFNSIESLTDNAGYAIAFMMQYNPKIKDLISIKQLDSPVKMKGLRRAVNKGKRYDFRNLTEREYKSLNKTPYLKEIGKDIGEQLRLLYSKKPINTSDSFFRKLWSAISEFFKKMTPETRLKFSVIRNYTNSIANAVKLGDYTIIRKSDFKPGTDTLPSIVDIGEAFKNNPYEESIVYTLNKHGISLAGGAAIASQGTLYRPSENPLHDLDFEAGNKSKGEIESILRNTFKAYSHTNTIVNENGRVTYTYLVMDREFEERRDVPGIGVNVIYDKKTGERLGTRIHSELVIEKEGVKGKMLDFFTGDTTNVFDNVTINYNGKNYLFSDYRNAMSFKINVARLKDIWDYNRFIPRNENGKIVSLAKLKNSNKERVQNLVRNARIIWGHPAIGKTTYLERNNDILEWDKEVNPKRDVFVRDQIDPNHTMDVNSTEYKRLKQEYLSNWENNSEYIKFLTREWNKLKDRAQRENKRLFASPLPLLSIFRNDFDLIVALPEKQFIERNKARGGSEVGSLSWKQALDRQLVGIDTNKIVYTDKYFSEFMRDTLGVTWGTLNNAELEALQARGWSEEKFNSISQVERDNAIECAGL